MRSYHVAMAPSAQRELDRLPKKMIERILEAIAGLAENPRPHGSLKLQGGDNRYRIRVGNYRVIYSIFDDLVKVLVIRIRHRKDAY